MDKVENIEKLKSISKEIRLSIMSMLHEAKSGHSGGSLGMTDVFTTLFFNVMNHNPEDPKWEDRDHFILSNGHICPVLYSTLAEAGYFSKDELKTLRKFGSRLQGHPSRTDFDLVETSTGPLGQGILVAAGMAKGLKMQNKNNKIFVSSSDGEHQEGATWETLMFAAKHNLDNLIVFIDRNQIQIGGNTEDIMEMESLADKLRAFNWNVIEADGHNYEEILKAFNQAKENKGKPTTIIFKTTIGKGVSFMEGDYEWHGKAPNDEEYQKAVEEINNG